MEYQNSTVISGAPGSLNFIGKQKVKATAIEVLCYDPDKVVEHEDVALEKLFKTTAPHHTNWINIIGLHEVSVVKHIGDHLNIHQLVQEDILNTTHQPKYEEYPDYVYITLKQLHYQKDIENIEIEQISFVFMDGLLVTFQENELDHFNGVRDRLIRPTTKIRHRKSDYLCFALIDVIVDNYLMVIEQFGIKIDQLENELLKAPNKKHLTKINRYKREINFLRKTIRPVRELVLQFRKSESDLIAPETKPYLKDLEDHITQATEAIEIYKDILNDQLNFYNTSLNNKLNDILRILTVFSVVFIPLTFLAGIYGTNFKYLPELEYKFAYPIFWGVLILTALSMIYFFKKKQWL